MFLNSGNENTQRKLLAEMYGNYSPGPEAKKRKASDKLFELGEMYRDRKCQDQFIQLASISVSRGFSNGQLSEMMGRGEDSEISHALYAKLKSHVQADRAGKAVKFRAPFHRNRTMSKQSIIDGLKRTFLGHGMANKDFNHIIRFLAPSRDKILGPLDTSTDINCRQNFATIRMLLKRFAGIIEGDETLTHTCQETEQLLNFNEIFLKSANGLKAAEHVGAGLDRYHECNVASHCVFHLLSFITFYYACESLQQQSHGGKVLSVIDFGTSVLGLLLYPGVV